MLLQLQQPKKFEEILGNRNIVNVQTFGHNSNVHLVLQQQAIAILKHSLNKSRIKNEFDLLMKCQSENVIQVGSFYEDSNNYFFDMRFANQKSLDIFMNQFKSKISLSYAKQVTWQLICGLYFLHKKNILHCDLKLENVLINISNDYQNQRDKIIELYISDFGSAYDCSVQFKQQYETTFMNRPPEQFENQEWTFASDMFQLGILLYQIFLNKHPFFDENIQEMEKNIKNKIIKVKLEDIFDIGNKQQHICVAKERQELINLINDCLDKNPNNRPKIENIKENCLLRIFCNATDIEQYIQKIFKINTKQNLNQISVVLSPTIQCKNQLNLTSFELLMQKNKYTLQNYFSKKKTIIIIAKNQQQKKYFIELQYYMNYNDYLYQIHRIKNQVICQNCDFVEKIDNVWVENMMFYIASSNSNKAKPLYKLLKCYQNEKNGFPVLRKQSTIIQIMFALLAAHYHNICLNSLSIYNTYSFGKNEEIFVKETDQLYQIKILNFNGSINLTEYSKEFKPLTKEQSRSFSPEQNENFMHFSKSSDIYALGVLTYMLSYGQHMYENAEDCTTDNIKKIVDQVQLDKQIDLFSKEVITTCLLKYNQTNTIDLLRMECVQSVSNNIFTQQYKKKISQLISLSSLNQEELKLKIDNSLMENQKYQKIKSIEYNLDYDQNVEFF